jgi:hypothetical protein
MTIEDLNALVATQGRGAAWQRERDLIAIRGHVYNATVAHAKVHAYLALALDRAQRMDSGPTDIADELQLSEALGVDLGALLRRIDAEADAAANAGDEV